MTEKSAGVLIGWRLGQGRRRAGRGQQGGGPGSGVRGPGLTESGGGALADLPGPRAALSSRVSAGDLRFLGALAPSAGRVVQCRALCLAGEGDLSSEPRARVLGAQGLLQQRPLLPLSDTRAVTPGSGYRTLPAPQKLPHVLFLPSKE